MGSREELEKIVGPTAVDERPVRDLWPLAIMQERAGNVPPQVLVVRPAGREQVAARLIASRSSGPESSRYGSIEDMVLGLAVVLADGTFAAPRPGPRSAAGPALHQLFLGAEGGLGVVVGAVLRLHRLPETTFGRG